MMSNQSTDLLNVRDKNNPKEHKTLKASSETADGKIMESQTISTDNLNGHADMDTVTANGFEFFTRFAYCQALLYKAWVEASDKLAGRVTKSVNHDHNNSKELSSLYIDTFEETFTDLFRSREFASNLGKLLNSLMECIKEKDNISEIFLNNLPKISENSKTGKDQRVSGND